MRTLQSHKDTPTPSLSILATCLRKTDAAIDLTRRQAARGPHVGPRDSPLAQRLSRDLHPHLTWQYASVALAAYIADSPNNSSISGSAHSS